MFEPGRVRGDFHRDKDRYEAAIKDYSEAIEQQPDFLVAFGNRGLARF